MTADTTPGTQVKHVKTVSPFEKEYWTDVEVPVIHPGETPPEPEGPPPQGAEGATKSKTHQLPRPHVINPNWENEDAN